MCGNEVAGSEVGELALAHVVKFTGSEAETLLRLIQRLAPAECHTVNEHHAHAHPSGPRSTQRGSENVYLAAYRNFNS